MKARLPISLVLFLTALASPDAGTALAQETEYSRFGHELWELAQGAGVPGMSAAIVRDQEIVWAEGFGYADYNDQTPATERTLYRLASVSKPFAAVLLMQLVEAGRLDIDAPMREFGPVYRALPEAEAAREGVRASPYARLFFRHFVFPEE